jgi:hypothetical protein
MVVGFNHNFSYKGQVYHVQTEDSGIKNPHIITLLYRGGTILSSKKTSYADIIKIDNLEVVVEELMKSQHREMLRLLKNGDLDEVLGLPLTTAKAFVAPLVVPAAPPTVPAAATVTATPSAPLTTPINPPEKRPAPPPPPSPAKLSLDEIILSYMVGEDNKK